MVKLKLIKRAIKYWFQRRTRGWSDDDCWNLDYEFIKWVNSRFKVYKEQARVDMSFHTFKYKRKEYTQGELIDEIIRITDKLVDEHYYFNIVFGIGLDEDVKEYERFIDMFSLVIGCMWW